MTGLSTTYQIRASGLEKKFQREWVFRNLTYDFFSDKTYAFTGPNGSGKSTLLLILSGLLPATAGEVKYFKENTLISEEHFFKYISIAAPYCELIEEFTLQEFLRFHFRFKEIISGYNISEVISSISLENARNKPVKQFSSGMKQRLKLGLGFYSQNPVLLLDEPCSNLDTKGIDWYKAEIEKAKHERLVIICSNQTYEYDFCENIINLERFKY